MDVDVAVREIKIQLEGSDDPHSIKFSDDIDIDDLRFLLREVIENIAEKHKVGFVAFDPRSSKPLDLDNLPVSDLETIILNPKATFTENEEFYQGKGPLNQNPLHTPTKVMAANVDQRTTSEKRPAIVGGFSKRINKQESDSIVKTHFLKRTRWSESGALVNTLPDYQYEKKQTFKDNYCETEIETRKIVFSETDTQQKAVTGASYDHQVINLEADRQNKPKKQVFSTAMAEDYSDGHLNSGKIGQTPLDGNDNKIYSFKVGNGPYTFALSGRPYSQKTPPPLYLTHEESKVLRELTKQAIFHSQEITKDGELHFTDKAYLKSQQGVTSEMLKRVAKAIFEGRSLATVTMPVRIFEPRSMTERCSDWFCFAPVYLTPASQTKDPLERIKYVTSFIVGGLYVSLTPFKPFNPILGETYQGEYPEHNIKIYTEMISHTPPMLSFYLAHPDWKAHGTFELKADMSLIHNCLTIKREGLCTVEFKDGHKIKFSYPHFRLGGVTSGERIYRYKHHIKVIDEANGLKSVIRIDPSDRPEGYDKKRKDVLSGLIYRYKAGIAKKDADDEKFKDLEQKIEEVHGQWLKHLYFGNKKWWDIDENLPVRNISSENPLPSDWRYREDLLWVKRGNKEYAEEWKVVLEERQRFERKLRETYHKKHKK